MNGRTLAAGAAWLALASTSVLAQTTSQNQELPAEPKDTEEPYETIVVTGTLLRGIAPPGAQALMVSREDAIATGATTTAQLLANVPQLGDFNTRPIYRGVFNVQQTVNHPELRNLSGHLIGSSATLLLANGRRLPGMGVRQTTPDSDAIPPGAIERVEVVTDGGSAIYGSDAVGGVVNYITRKRFDGVEVSGGYGFADDYYVTTGDLTAGSDWGSGSVFATYSFNRHDAIYGRDRDWAQNRDWINGVGRDTACSPGNVIIGSTIYTLPDLTPSTLGNRCDNNEDETIYPTEERHSVYAGFVQELSERIEVGIDTYYTHRRNVSDGGPATVSSVTVQPTNRFYRSTGDANANRVQRLSFNLSPLLGDSSDQVGTLETWGVATHLTAQIGKSWQVRGLLNYGYGSNTVRNDAVNTTLLSQLVAAEQFNPYDLLDPINAAFVPELTNRELYGRGNHDLYQYRAIADGPLFTLPGGQVNLAVGAEYLEEDYRVSTGTGVPNDASIRQRGEGHRNVKAGFAELFVPIVGEGNRVPGVYSLALSAAGRYDDYSDFGGTFNPKLGLTYEPIEWFRLRGNWSKSFQAPSLADDVGALANNVTVISFIPFLRAGVPPRPGQVQVFLSGSQGNLDPQKANIWSVGVDLEPTLINGLGASITYYNIKFKDRIASPEFTRSDFYDLYPEQAIVAPSVEVLQSFAAQAPDGLDELSPYFAEPDRVYSIIDSRRGNFSRVDTSGIDFNVNYHLSTSFGAIFARTAGNYVLKRKEQVTDFAPVINTVNNTSRLHISTTLGAVIGGLLGQVTWLHSGSFDIIPSSVNLNQSKVNAYDTFNLFFKYEFESPGIFNDLALTLNVDNVFNKDPPVYRGTELGYGNGFTLGRLFQFGIRARF